MTLPPPNTRTGIRKLIASAFIPTALSLCLFLMPAALGRDVKLGKRDYPPQFEGAKVANYKSVGDVKLSLWIFNPKNHQASDKRAAIVFFFGGGWNGGSPSQFETQCRHLAEHGMVAITADYRVFSRNNVKPTSCVADARSAIRWVRAHAAELGIDPQRIVAGGGSAGGHLAAATAFIKEFDEPAEDASVSAAPNALVLFNPALVLAPLAGYKFGENAGGRATEERFGTKPENISPAHHIKPGAPPAIVFHGKADTTVPFATAEAFAAEMKKAGNKCELVGYDGATHGFFNKGSEREDTIRRMDVFLKSLGYLGD